MLVEDPVFKRGYSILDTGCKIQDAGWMNRMVGWLSHGRVPCALSLEPYVFVRYRMPDTGCKIQDARCWSKIPPGQSLLILKTSLKI